MWYLVRCGILATLLQIDSVGGEKNIASGGKDDFKKWGQYKCSAGAAPKWKRSTLLLFCCWPPSSPLLCCQPASCKSLLCLTPWSAAPPQPPLVRSAEIHQYIALTPQPTPFCASHKLLLVSSTLLPDLCIFDVPVDVGSGLVVVFWVLIPWWLFKSVPYGCFPYSQAREESSKGQGWIWALLRQIGWSKAERCKNTSKRWRLL